MPRRVAFVFLAAVACAAVSLTPTRAGAMACSDQCEEGYGCGADRAHQECLDRCCHEDHTPCPNEDGGSPPR